MVGVGFAAVQALGVAGQFASGIMSAKSRQAEFAEQLRALQMKKEYTLGIAKVRAGASGVTMDSVSTVDYLAGLAGEFDREIANLKHAKKTAGSAALVGNLAGLATGGAQTYLGLAQLNNFWK